MCEESESISCEEHRYNSNIIIINNLNYKYK